LIPSGLAYLADNITSKGNILGASKEKGARWAKGLNLPKETDTLFFAGCGYQYASELESLMSLIRTIDKSGISTEFTASLASFQKKLGIDATGVLSKVMAGSKNPDAQPLNDAVKVLKNIGINLGYLAEEEPCCGGALYYIGLGKEFAQHAQSVRDNLRGRGIKRVVSIVPSCTYALGNLIANNADGNGLEVKHFCQVVAENIQSLKLRFPREVKVTYHDPCQLSRFLNLIDEPRQILRSIAGIELIETDWTNGQWSTCCGGGGGFEAVFPELSQILAVNRVKELMETTPEIIITHCPGCILQLKAGLKELKVDGVEVLDLAQVVAMAMET